MTDAKPQALPLPILSRVALGLIAGFLLIVAWDQSVWWRSLEDYSFGYLAPVFSLYVIHERWSEIRELLTRPDEATSRGWLSLLTSAAWVLACLLGGLMFILGAANATTTGPSPANTLATTLGAILSSLGLLWFCAPSGSAGNGSRDGRWRLLPLFAFPLLVWLISAPLVTVVESQLRRFLLQQVVTVVFHVFDAVGLPIQQQGSVLVLPNGKVGVEEACSGIRSLTACLFAGSFLSAVFLNRWWKKIALILSALVLALITNLLRSLFLTAWAYHYGSQAIQGAVHDIASYSVLGLTTLCLLCLIPLFNLKASEVVVVEEEEPGDKA